MIVDWNTLLSLRDEWRRQGKTVVWTNGCFDILHLGHVQSLEMARRLGDILVVGVNSDETIRKIKGPSRPIFPVHQRALVISALRCVDYVIVFDESTPEIPLKRLKPEVHCKGVDYAPPHGKPIPELETVKEYGGRVEFLPMIDYLSTTEIVRRIQALPHDENHV